MQMKAIEQYIPVVLFIMLCKVILIVESVDEILKCVTIQMKAIEQYLCPKWKFKKICILAFLEDNGLPFNDFYRFPHLISLWLIALLEKSLQGLFCTVNCTSGNL